MKMKPMPKKAKKEIPPKNGSMKLRDMARMK